MRYLGREAHAAVAPYLGVNAADAVTVAQVAIGLLRQQLAPGQMMHGIVTDGGQATNVIPARAELQYTMRATDGDLAARTRGQDRRLLPGRRGGDRLRLRGQPRPSRRTTSWPPTRGWPTSSAPRCERLGRTPVPADAGGALPLGSTDMGNVTQVMPGIHPIVGIDADGASVHQPAFAAAAARAQRRHRGRRGGDHAGAHGGPAGRDARRAGPGARAAQAQASRHEPVATTTDAWLAAHYDDLVALAPTHPPPPRAGPPGVRDHAVRRRRSWPTPGSTPRCCPAAPG